MRRQYSRATKQILIVASLALVTTGCSTLVDKTADAIPGCASRDVKIESYVPGVMSDTVGVSCGGRTYRCSYSSGRVYDCKSPEAEKSAGVES